ncbi:MAG: response regulator [Treponema sp.]|nr:response regulator [Treponema sp.]
MEKKKVLAIDDSMQQINTFQGILASQYIFRAAKSASDALSFLNSNQVDVVLLDIEMPNISGFEFLKDIRRIPSYIDVPIIIVSSKSGEEFDNQVKTSGVADVLSKPVVPEKLIETIEKHLSK